VSSQPFGSLAPQSAPAPLHTGTHAPDEQVFEAVTESVAQTIPHVPQWFLFDDLSSQPFVGFASQFSPEPVRVGRQPFAEVTPFVWQLTLQAPQFPASFVMLVSHPLPAIPSQVAWVELQLSSSHVPLLQLPTPFG